MTYLMAFHLKLPRLKKEAYIETHLDQVVEMKKRSARLAPTVYSFLFGEVRCTTSDVSMSTGRVMKTTPGFCVCMNVGVSLQQV
jgi:hypothetical protein